VIKLVRETPQVAMARKESLDMVRLIYHETYSKPWQEEDIATTLVRWGQTQSHAICGVDENDNLHGIASFFLTFDGVLKEVIAAEHFIAIFPQYRNGTLYLRLLKEMTKWATELGATELRIGTHNVNKEARDAYEAMLKRIGFGESHIYYSKQLW